jgi:HSP20 family protein
MVTRWDPWSDLFDVQRRMSQLMRSSLGEPSTEAEATRIVPAVDVFSRNGDLVVRAELPGVDPERDIDIEVREQTLTIRGERRMDETIERGNYYRMEAAYGRFQRSVPLPEGVKPDDIKASYENGVLEVVVPKAAEMREPRRIPIEAKSSGRRSIEAG